MAFQLDKENRIEFTDDLWTLLRNVNRETNKLEYETDQAQFGTAEYWTQYADRLGKGDCDDYTLTKRRLLIEAGVPYECLCPAACMLGGSGHLVLIVRTTQGAYVLDSNLDQVKPWRGLRVQGLLYEWIVWYNPVRKAWVSFKAKGAA